VAPEPPLAPPAVLVPFVAPDVGLVPSVAPRVAPVPPGPHAAPHAAPTPPPAPRAAPHHLHATPSPCRCSSAVRFLHRRYLLRLLHRRCL
jgi:hypothetical protein